MKTSKSSQAVSTIQLLLALLAEPRVTAATLAKTIGRSENWVNISMMRFREAGLDIEYDRSKGRYEIQFSKKLKETLEPLAGRLRVAVGEALDEKEQEITLDTELPRYSVKQFSKVVGGTPANIYNMISGYKGQRLPVGWCAYQVSGKGKWWIQKMPTDKTGTKYLLPVNVRKTSSSVVIGEGKPMKDPKTAVAHCIAPGCKKPVFAKGFCYDDYFRARRHPERFPKPKAS